MSARPSPLSSPGALLRRRRGRALAAALGALLASIPAGCTLGSGNDRSTVQGELNAPDCWFGAFDLQPDYFAAVPFNRDDTLQIRIQNGGDFQSFSDGVLITVEELQEARRLLRASTRTPKSVTLKVSLPPEVTPPGVPIKPIADPARVHMSLYLQRSCRTQNVALYALDEVTLGAGGECVGPNAPTIICAGANSAGGATPGGGDAGGGVSTNADASADGGETAASAPATTIGRSSITFFSLFSGNPDEPLANERLTKADFDVYLADPRDACPGGFGPPPPCRGKLRGSFDFYFQRGRPAQPFP